MEKEKKEKIKKLKKAEKRLSNIFEVDFNFPLYHRMGEKHKEVKKRHEAITKEVS